MKVHKVLAVSKRLGELCVSKAMLNAAGFEVTTVTSAPIAEAVGRAVHFEAALVCQHSFTDQERNQIAKQLEKTCPGLVIIAKCPGCTCVEDNGTVGELKDLVAIDSIKKTTA